MKHFYLIGLTFLMLACSTHKNFVITDDYARKKIKDKSLGIVYIPSEPVIESNYIGTKFIEYSDQKSIKDDDPKKAYKNIFTKNLIENLKKYSSFESIELLQPEINEQFKTVELTLDKKRKLKFLVPEDGYKIKTDSTNPDFILFIQNLGLAYNQITFNYQYLPAHQYGKFLFWDNNQNKIVSYGEFDIASDFSNLSDAHKHIVVFYILNRTPFRNERILKPKMPR